MTEAEQAAVWAIYGPRIREARELEDDRRLAAFVAHDKVRHVCCGIVLQPLTLRRLGLLALARNAYVTRDTVPPPNDDPNYARWWAVQNTQFIWIVGPHDVCIASERDAFIERMITQPLDATFKGIRDYLEYELGCVSPVRGSADASDYVGGPCFIAWDIHRLAEKYGWHPSLILDLPMSQIAQLDQIAFIERETKAGRKPVIINGESDRLIAEALKVINEQ